MDSAQVPMREQLGTAKELQDLACPTWGHRQRAEKLRPEYSNCVPAKDWGFCSVGTCVLFCFALFLIFQADE